MDNQHRKIKSYRELSQAEIDDMNSVKDIENQVGDIIERLSENIRTDTRLLAIARTHLQTGFMFAVRSIAQPDSRL